MIERQMAAARLAASALLCYPDAQLLSRIDQMRAVAAELPDDVRVPLSGVLDAMAGMDPIELQAHFVSVFDMKRKACPYLTYWTDGDTRNRGQAILRFKQAYLEAGYDLGPEELADHLAVVLEFAAIGDTLTGEALLAEHQEAIHLLRDALAKLDSPYAGVLDVVVATLPDLTPQVRDRMARLAASGPPVESVGLAPYGREIPLEPIGARR